MEERDYILIERYIASDLSETERAEVEQRRKDDPEFRQELTDFEKVKEALTIRQREKLRQRFKERDKVLDSGKKKSNDPRSFPWLWIAVGVIVVISFLLWKFVLSTDHPTSGIPADKRDSTLIKDQLRKVDTFSHQVMQQKEIPTQDNNKKQDEQKANMAEAAKKYADLFAENFKPYKDESMNPQSRGGNDLTPFDQFRKDYWEENFKEAVLLFSKLGPSYQSNDNLRFMYANALAKIDQIEVAQLELTNIVNHHHTNYLQEAHWYLGLLYLKQGDMLNAKKELQYCVDTPKGYNKKEAKVLLEKIK